MSVWDGEDYWPDPAPGRDAVVWSVAGKVLLLVAIVAAIAALWALTSPITQQHTDATLGPPMGARVDPGEPG